MHNQKLSDAQLADLLTVLGLINKHEQFGDCYSLAPLGKMSYRACDIVRIISLADIVEVAAIRNGAVACIQAQSITDPSCIVYQYGINDGMITTIDTDLCRAKIEACALYLEGRVLKCSTRSF